MVTDQISNSPRRPGLSQSVTRLEALDSESVSTVSSYVPGFLLEELRRSPDRAIPWIESVEGTLLLSDISGFTRLSEGLAESGKEGAERLTNLMNGYFEMVLDIARSYGGSNLKFGGDALLLLFRGDNHAGRAVATGISMRRATQKYAFQLEHSRIRLNMTLGVHSDVFYFVASGIPGQRMQHFILGEGVNRIAQVQASATTGQLLATENAFRQLGGAVEVEQQGDAYRIVRLSKRFYPAAGEMEITSLPGSVSELLPYIPPPIVQVLNSSGVVKSIEGEHRRVTIAFINVLGVNELLSQRGTEVLLRELQQYLTTVIRLAHQYGGFLVSNDIYTSGIKLIVIFGAPIAHEHDSANALRFALDLKWELSQSDSQLAHRIGVNSGFVFAGDVGAPYRQEYTVMGDAVNLAARLMSSASPNQILVSRTTADEAGPGILVQSLEPIKVKGKKEPVEIGSVEAELVLQTGVTQQSGAIFGREAEVETFRQLCLDIEEGGGHCVVISGNAGIGKSRLLAEFVEQLGSRDWSVFRGSGYSYSAAKPFAPWVSVLNALFQITPEESVQVRSGKVLDFIRQSLPNRIEMASLFNPLLGLDIPLSDVVRSISDAQRKERFFEIISAIFQNVSQVRPIGIIIEDLHWADSSSIELISYLSHNLRRGRLLLCLTHRPKADMLLSLPDEATTVFALSELPQSTALQMVSDILDEPSIPETIANIIFSKAQGNPLFLEEIAISLRRSGGLERLKNLSSLQLADQVAALNIPDRVQSLVMSRIDALDASAKQTLRIASVIGDEFDLPTLANLLDMSEYEPLQAQLQRLTQQDLAHPEAIGTEVIYHFKHTLIREVAYDSLLFSRRRELHQRVGTYLENKYRRELEPFYESLAHHYSQSRDRLRTRLYSARSAEKAQRLFAHREAIEYYNRGLDTIEEKGITASGLRSFFVERIADCYEASGNHAEAARVYLQAARRWQVALRSTSDPDDVKYIFGKELPFKVRKAALQHKIAVACERNSEYDNALKRLDFAGKELPARQPRQATKIALTRCLTYFRKGKYEDAIQWGRLGLSLSRRTQDLSNLAYAYNILSNSYLDTGQIRKAIRYREQAIRLYEDLRDLAGQAEANNNLGASYQMLGEQDKALQHFQRSLALCERVGNFTNVAIAHNNIGEVFLTMGRLDEAIEHLKKVVDTYEEKGDPLACAGLSLVNLSRAYQRKNDYGGAYEYLEKGMGFLRKAGARGLLVDAQLQKAELDLATSHFEIAMTTCQEALKAAHTMGLKPLEARGFHIQGRINTSQGKFDESLQNFQDSIALAEHMDADYEKGLALFYLGQTCSILARDKNKRRQCRQNLKQAASVFKRIGARADLSQVLQFENSLNL